MAEPVTAASIVLVVGKAAAKQFGKEIAKALAGKLFAKDDTAIRDSLANLDKKLSETLDLARSIHAMVLELPALIDALIERKELDSRHAELAGVEANFRSARRWTDTLAGPARTEFSSAWEYIVAHEFRIEALAKLPRFGEVGIGISKGELRRVILDGIDQRIDHNSRTTQAYQATIALAAATIEAGLASPYVKEGRLLDASPWATWAMNGPRNMIITDYVFVRDESGGHDMPIRREVEDTAWRDGLSSTREVLSAQRKKLEDAMQGLHACLYLDELLKSYRKVLVGRKRS